MTCTIPDIEVFEQIMEGLEPACEHPEHERNPKRHDGPALWIVTYPATACGCGRMIRLVCERWRQFVINDAIGLTCVHPGYLMTPDEMAQITFDPINSK